MGDCPGQVKWNFSQDNVNSANAITPNVTSPKYSFLGEHLRHVAPSALQCSMFCGGRQCKYCNPSPKFKKEEMIIDGLYSAWVTDKILATSRPSTEAIEKFNIIKQFHLHGITSIINLQHAGEHTACGFGLESGGFSYVPEDFMDNNIFFYNFGWNDYGVRSLQSIVDMVQVMDFAILNGKAAVHCHAGLGRTGVLIACYLIFSTRCTATEAIQKVRHARPNSIQTRGQLNCVKDFFSYIKPMWIIFAEENAQVTLQHFLNRQRRLLHGEEARTLRYIPKIVFTILQRFLQLAGVDYDLAACVKVRRFSFMKTCTSDTQAPVSIANFKTETNESIPNCKKTHMDDDLLYLQKQKSKMLHTQLVNNELQLQMKAKSMPDVVFSGTNGETITKEEVITKQKNNSRIILEPVQSAASTRKKKKGLKDKLIANLQKSDNDGLGESFNSFVESDTLFSLSSSLDSSILDRSLSMYSDTSVLSESSNNGLTCGEEVLKYLACRSSDIQISNRMERFKRKLNIGEDAWGELREETNMAVLSGVFWLWLKHLQGPVINNEHVEIMKSNITDPEKAASKIEKELWILIHAFVTSVSEIDGRSDDTNRVLRRFAVCVTRDESIPRIKYCNPKVEIKLYGDESSGQIVFKFLLSWLGKLKHA